MFGRFLLLQFLEVHRLDVPSNVSLISISQYKNMPSSKLNASNVLLLGNLAQWLSSSQLDMMDKSDLESSIYQLTHSDEKGDQDGRMKKFADAIYKKSASS